MERADLIQTILDRVAKKDPAKAKMLSHVLSKADTAKAEEDTRQKMHAQQLESLHKRTAGLTESVGEHRANIAELAKHADSHGRAIDEMRDAWLSNAQEIEALKASHAAEIARLEQAIKDAVKNVSTINTIPSPTAE